MFPIKKRPEPKSGDPKADHEDEEEHLKLRLLMSLRDMITEGYPVPLKGKLQETYSDFVMTKVIRW